MTLGRLVAVGLALAFFSGGCGGNDEEPATPAPGFDTELPAGWKNGSDADLEQLTQVARQSIAEALGVTEDQVRIEGEAIWFDSSDDGFATNVNVLSEEIPDGLSDDQYIDANLESIGAIGAADVQRQPGPDVDGSASEQIDYSAGGRRDRAAETARSGSGARRPRIHDHPHDGQRPVPGSRRRSERDSG